MTRPTEPPRTCVGASNWTVWPDLKAPSDPRFSSVSRIDACSQLHAGVDGNYSLSRQPSLVIDGQEVSLDTDSYAISGLAKFIRNLDGRWSAGGIVRGGHEDPLGRYRFTARAHAGISRDWFRADDPRGNQLAVVYLAGAQYDRYNARNAEWDRARRDHGQRRVAHESEVRQWLQRARDFAATEGFAALSSAAGTPAACSSTRLSGSDAAHPVEALKRLQSCFKALGR